jgi:hypothetical protein
MSASGLLWTVAVVSFAPGAAVFVCANAGVAIATASKLDKTMSLRMGFFLS